MGGFWGRLDVRRCKVSQSVKMMMMEFVLVCSSGICRLGLGWGPHGIIEDWILDL